MHKHYWDWSDGDTATCVEPGHGPQPDHTHTATERCAACYNLSTREGWLAAEYERIMRKEG